MEQANKPSSAPLDAELIARLQALRGTEPTRKFAQKMGLSDTALTRALAGLPVYAGTRSILETKLGELQK